MSSSIETRGAWLWEKMMTIYGGRFLDMWEGVDVSAMQATWTEGLRGVPREQIMLGIAKLYHTKHPPTLPEFLELCASPSAMYRTTPAITDDCRTPPEEARGKLATIAQSITRNAPEPDQGIAWAFRLIERSQRGEHITANQLAIACEAGEAWTQTHGTARAQSDIELPPRILSPHIYGEAETVREPGDDDE